MKFLIFLAFSSLVSLPLFADNQLKLGIGTDASLGLAVGAEYQIDMTIGTTPIKVGPAFYYSTWTEDYEESNTYTETSTTYMFGFSANAYSKTNDETLSFIYGFGAAFMSNDWKETSPGDSSIGPLIDGLYTDEEENSGASIFLNVGINKQLSDTLAVEVNVPMFFIPYYYGTAIAPAIIVSIVIPM